MSHSLSSLRKMLDICNNFSEKYHITFNAKKSKLLIFGNVNSDINLLFQGNKIAVCNKEMHVGNLIGNTDDLESLVIEKACNDLYSRVNLLLTQLGHCHSHLLYHLLNTYCMSLYGSQLWNFALVNNIKKFYVMMMI